MMIQTTTVLCVGMEFISLRSIIGDRFDVIFAVASCLLFWDRENHSCGLQHRIVETFQFLLHFAQSPR